MAGPIISITFVTLKSHPESNIAEPEEEVGKILLQMNFFNNTTLFLYSTLISINTIFLSLECPEVSELISVDIKFYTGNYAEEVSWEIANTGCKSGGQYQDSYKTHDITCQLPAGQQLLVCEDVYADGWNNGWIEILGERYCDAFDGERKEITINVV